MGDAARRAASFGHLPERLRYLLERLAPQAVKQALHYTIPPTALEPHPWGPRPVLDLESLDELAENVLSYGIKEPLLARRLESGRYQVLSGSRVLAAAKRIHLPIIPVLVVDIDEPTAVAIALTECSTRGALTPWAEAQQLSELRERLDQAGHATSPEELSLLTGHSTDWAADRIRIADRLTPTVLERAGVPIHDLNSIPKEKLLGAAEAEVEAERAALLRTAVEMEDRAGGGAS